MRIGFNPEKNKIIKQPDYSHQVIIPVFIPHHENYFKDSFTIFKLCLQSLFNTTHHKTFISIVNNGCDLIVSDYLDGLLRENKIQELVHAENIGKINAILKGLVGNKIELVTISDADVMFLPNWQSETTKVFNEISKAGVVGIVPQFKMYEANCGSVLFDTIFSSKLKFLPVKNKEAMIQFYDSIGWDKNYNQDYLEYALGLEINKEFSVLIGSGHFVATYKKDIFTNVISYNDFKMGGNSEGYLDKMPLKKDYWRLTTLDNYAYHMGNTLENWMNECLMKECKNTIIIPKVTKRKQINSFLYFIKNRIFIKFISIKFLVKIFLKCKKLPKEMIEKY